MNPSEAQDLVVVYVTAPQDRASDIAHHLVRSGSAACVNVIPKIQSIYRWKGEVTEDAEALLVVKTTRAALEALEAAVTKVHPYEVPEIIALPIIASFAPYADWVRENAGAAPC